MKKLSAIFVIPLMLLGAFLAPSSVHAATGVVSVNGGTLINAPSSATTVSVPIQISGSDALNGFDIQVVADPTLLSGASVSLTGSVLNASVVLECINGVLVAGTVCSSQDRAGVVHLAAVQSGKLTTAPTTGLLFTIVYSIKGSTTGTPITFNTGCSGTSVTSGDCVTIANGGATAVPETDQAGSFANLIDFKMTPAFAKVSTPSAVAITDAVNYLAEGGYSDILNEACAATAGLTCTLTSGSVDLTIGTTGSDTATVSGTTSGSVTVTATGQGLFGPVVTHSVTIPVLISPADFSVALSKASVTVPRGGSDSSVQVNLGGVSHFSGTVTLAGSSIAGVTGSAPSATLTPDGSGYSSAVSTLTVSVGSGVATGTYTLTVTGMSGSTSHSASLSVVVPGQDFSIAAVPNSISIVRGGSVAANLNLASVGNFAATVTFTTVITNQGTDSCCLTTNITPAYSPGSAVLTAGSSLAVAFFASTVGGTAPPATYTATGNYTATITATGGGQTHVVVITFNVQDFALTGSFCDGSTSNNPGVIASTPNANVGPGIVVGNPCSTITITTGSGIQDPLNGQGLFGNPTPYVLWVQTNAYGGLVTDGFDGLPSVAALNPEIPARGFTIPALSQVLSPRVDHRMCLLATYWPNGTQVPYSYLVTHGPLIAPGGGFYVGLDELGVAGVGGIPWGCSFDAQTFPNDVVGVQNYNDHFMTACDKDAHGNCTDSDIAADVAATGTFDTNECGPKEGNFCPVPPANGNPDAFQVVAMTITDPATGASLTAPGGYTFKLCGQIGVLQHCSIYGLDVVNGAQFATVDWNHQISVKHSRPVQFFSTVVNPDSTAQYIQVTVSVTGDNGNTFSVTSAVVLVGAGKNATLTTGFGPVFTTLDIGHTFTFTSTILEGATADGLTATSTQTTFGGQSSGSFLVKH
jgi:hypothetical protein